MDIARLSTAMSHSNLSSSVSISMMKKALDMMEQNGKDMLQMLQQTTPHPDSTIDIRI